SRDHLPAWIVFRLSDAKIRKRACVCAIPCRHGYSDFLSLPVVRFAIAPLVGLGHGNRGGAGNGTLRLHLFADDCFAYRQQEAYAGAKIIAWPEASPMTESKHAGA